MHKIAVWIAAHWKPWEWPEHLMKWLRGFHEVREAKHKADKAKIELQTAQIQHRRTAAEWAAMQREQKIQEYYQAIRKHCEATGKGFVLPDKPVAAPGEEPELVEEAWLKYKREINEKLNRSWRR